VCTQPDFGYPEIFALCGDGGGQMKRRPSFCDFCAFPEVSNEYPTDKAGIDWYACPACAELIENQDWDGLVSRCLAAYVQIRSLPDDEKSVVLGEVQARVRSFSAEGVELSPAL